MDHPSADAAIGTPLDRLGASPAEIEEVYRRRRAAFLRVAAQVTGDAETGHDVVQEAFARALRRRRSFRGAGALEAWIWRVVINAARDAARRRADLPSALLPERATADRAYDERAVQVREALARLPERQRLALFLRYHADLDYRAIAGALGVRVGTVSSTLSQAHAALRKLLEEMEA